MTLIVKRICFAVICMAAAVSIDAYFFSTHAFYWRDVILGGGGGFVVALLIFPRRVATDFRQSLIPLFRAYSSYLIAITKLFLHEKEGDTVEDKRYAVEKALLPPVFPEWVYRVGFNAFFRAGHRHFLVRTEQVGQILFAMHYVARHPVGMTLLDILRSPIQQCVANTEKLIEALVTHLELKALEKTVPDFADDIVELEQVFRKVAPLSLELLDMSQDYIYLVSFIYDLTDLRKVLLKLAEALR